MYAIRPEAGQSRHYFLAASISGLTQNRHWRGVGRLCPDGYRLPNLQAIWMQHEILAIRKACLGIVGRRADAIEGIVFRSRLWPGLRIGSFYRTFGIWQRRRTPDDGLD